MGACLSPMNALSRILEVAQGVVSARLGRGHPLYLVHALTARCNARCGFCAWNPDFYNPQDQLSTEAIQQLYTDARAAGFVGLSVWGGEPLLHKDFADLLRHARALGLETHIVTNGFLLEHKLDAVIDSVDRVCISVDHPSAVHDEIRGIPGLFERVVSATKALRERAPRKPVVWICTLQRANVDPSTLRDLVRLTEQLGVLGIYNGLREEAATTDADAGLDRYAPTQAQLTAAYETLRDLKRQGYPVLNSFTHMEKMAKGPTVYRCHWPKFMLPIEANGDVVDCMHWGTRPIANLKSTPFSEVLRHPRLKDLAGPAGEACHACVSIHRVEISAVCDGDLEPIRSWAMLRKPPAPRPPPLP